MKFTDIKINPEAVPAFEIVEAELKRVAREIFDKTGEALVLKIGAMVNEQGTEEARATIFSLKNFYKASIADQLPTAVNRLMRVLDADETVRELFKEKGETTE